MEIEANSPDEAKEIADDLPLPTDPDYLDSSFKVTDDDGSQQRPRLKPKGFPSSKIMKTKVLSLDTINANNRVYPKPVMEAAIKNAKSKIESQRFFLVDKQPDSTHVSLNNVVGVVEKLEIENNDLIADIKFLNTPNATALETMINNGLLHVRTAGIGSVKNVDNVYHINEDYEIISCFLTDNPA